MKKLKKLTSMALCMSMAATVMVGCGEQKQADSNDVTTLTWYVPAMMDCKDKDEVIDNANNLLKERYSLNIDFIFIDGGNYAQKLQTINAGLEEYDLCFVSNWKNDYYSNVANGSIIDITDMLEKYPDLKNSMRKEVWDAGSVNGKIYAVPNWQIQAKSTSFGANKRLLDKLDGFSIDSINTFDDITGYLEKVKKVSPESDTMGTLWANLTYHYNILPLLQETLPAAIYFNNNKGEKPVVMSMYESPEFEKYIRTRYSWVQKGLLTDKYDAGAMAKSSDNSKIKAPFVSHVYKPGIAAEMAIKNNDEFEIKPFSTAVLASSGVCAAMTAISTTSKHPEEALKLLDALNRDKEVMNLLCWGIEGKHYTKVSDNQIKIIPDSGYTRLSSFVLASQNGIYVLDTQDADLCEQITEYNDSAIISPLAGVTLNTENVSTEAANCNNVVKEQLESLEKGAVNPDEALPKFISDLKLAGSDDIIADIQKQVDEWWASK